MDILNLNNIQKPLNIIKEYLPKMWISHLYTIGYWQKVLNYLINNIDFNKQLINSDKLQMSILKK